MKALQSVSLVTIILFTCSLALAATNYNSSRSNKRGVKSEDIQAQVDKLVKQAQQDIIRKLKSDKAKRANTDSFFDIHVEIKVTVEPNDRVVRKKPGRTK